MRKILKLIRWYDWYDSKLPLFFLAYYYLLIVHNEVHIQSLILLLPLGVFFASLASFGYMINDYFDKTVDRISGKENTLSLLTHWQQIIVLLVVLSIGLFTFTPFYQHKFAITFLFLCYLSSILYSAPLLRLKEKSIWGVLCVSLAQRVFPILIVFAIFEHFKFDTFVFAILSFLIGIRWILIHQILDYDKDIQADVETFAVSSSPVKTYNLMLFFFGLEAIFALIFVGITYTAIPPILFVLIAYFLYELYLYPFWKKLGLRRILASYDFALLADFYYFWLPLLFSILLAFLNPWFFIIVGLEILWKTRYIKFDFGLIKLRRQCL
jgi:4-hydroxybenzoate polyprenyltransferase